MAACSSTQRATDLKRVGHLYDWVEPYGPDVCVYCGDPAFSRDHVTPVWYVASLGDLLGLHMRKLRHGLLVVPACRDCNGRLSGFVSFCVTDKRVELKARLRHRWRRLLESYDWQPEDMARLGRSLRERIEGMEAKRLAVLARLAFPRPGEAAMLRDGHFHGPV